MERRVCENIREYGKETINHIVTGMKEWKIWEREEWGNERVREYGKEKREWEKWEQEESMTKRCVS